ncbi:MAG: septum formation family protein [Pseudonocardia sp.]|nr:septum formation family protein [Pseudonocardia sp.]
MAIVGLLTGAAIMLLVATLYDTTGTKVPVLSRLASAPVPDSQRPLGDRTPPPTTPGTCLTWKRTDAADAYAVDCGRQHLFEQAGPAQLADFAPGAPMPNNDRFRALVNERCTPLVVKYLNGKYDQDGAFRAGALKPSQKSWNDGDRTLRCGIQRFSRSGELYAIVGKVADQDQADIRPAGTCLGIDGRFIGDPVDCSLPHAIESVGSIDLGQKFPGKYPSVGDQDGFLQPACSKLAASYAGGDNVISSKNLAVMWDNLTPESWAAGTRKVACNLAAQLPDRSGFAPITGSVKGPVQVGNQAAPPAQAPVPAGAPAPGSEPQDSDEDDGKKSDDAPEPLQAPELPKPSLVPLPGGGDLSRDHKLPENPLGDLTKPGANPLTKPSTGGSDGG